MGDSVRIVHVVITGRREFLGGDRHVMNLAVAQKARGLNPMLMTDTPGILAEALRSRGIPVVVMQGVDREAQFPAKEIMQDLIAQIRNFGAQLIHCHDLSGAKLAIPAANQGKIPCVFTVHVSAGRVLLSSYEIAKRMGLEFSMIAVSRREFDFLRKNGITESDLYYVPNGTRIFRAHEAREPHRPDLMLASSLTIDKGVDIAILAMVELRRRLGPDCPTLNVYGENPSGKYFYDMVHALGLNDIVRLHGFKLDIIEHSANSAILVMPSRKETGPLVVQEAMSRGMPIVATDVGDVPEMLPDQRYGRVVRPNSIMALADGIESLLKDIIDGHFNPSLVIERHRSRYTVEKMAENVEAVYKQILVNNTPC